MPSASLTSLMRTARDQNVAAMLQHLVAHGPTARKQLGRATGLSLTTVTRLAGNLVRSGVLTELPVRPVANARAGRPETPLVFAPGGRYVIGTHIHPRTVTASIFDLAGDCIASVETVCDSPDSDHVIPLAVAATGEMLGSVDRGKVLGIGISTGGVVDFDTGVVIDGPQLGWRQVDLRTPFAHLDLPVLVDSAVRCVAVGRHWEREPSSANTVLTVFVDNMVGTALMQDRMLHRGPGSSAGDIAHLPVRGGPGTVCECGRVDCLGVVVTNRALHARAVAAGLLAEDSAWADVATMEDSANGGLAALRTERARLLGEAVGMLNEFHNPDLTVITGYLGTAEIDTCVATAKARAEQTGSGGLSRIEHRDLPKSIWDQASAALVLDDFLRRPTEYDATLLD